MHLIQDRCDDHKINIIPVDNHITNTLTDIQLKMTLRELYRETYNILHSILNTRDIEIMRAKRLGITQDMIAKKHGISRSRVAQIDQKC